MILPRKISDISWIQKSNMPNSMEQAVYYEMIVIEEIRAKNLYDIDRISYLQYLMCVFNL